MERSFRRRLAIAPLFLAAITAWAVFHPGLFSPDSLDQLRQAVSWSFDDWHPPFPAIVTGILLKLGWTIPGVVGLQAFAWALSSALVLDTPPVPAQARGRAGAARERFRAAAWTLAVGAWAFLPPWPFYAVTFWKDCWAAIGLLLVTAGLLATARTCDPSAPTAKPRRAQGLMLAGAVLATLARHNAAVLLPIAGLGIALAERERRGGSARIARTIGILAPFLLVFIIGRTMPVVAPIASRPIGVVIMAHELAIATLAQPAIAAEAPYTAERIAPRYPVTTERGDLAALVRRTWWLGPDLGKTLDPAAVQREYTALVIAHPALVVELKLRSWLNLWSTFGSAFWHQGIIEPNDLGLDWSPRTASLRAAWLEAAGALREFGPTRVLLAGHLPWLLAGVLLFLAAAVRFAHRRDAVSAFRALAYAAPLVYALSFLAVFAVADYRYLYPATLTIQAMLLRITRPAAQPHPAP